MNSRRICVSLILLSFAFQAFSQIDSTRTDSIEEIIIYEYDTIYIQPDTIRITDTIFDVEKADSIKAIGLNKSRKNRTKRKENGYTMKGFLPRSIGFSIAPFIYLNPKTLSDTLKPLQVLNMAYGFQLNYYTDKYLISYRLAYSLFHERFTGTYNSFVLKEGMVSNGVYDSVMVVNNYQADYYYDYFSFDLFLGRKFKISQKLGFSFTFGASAGLLIGYKQGNTTVTNSMIRKENYSLIFSPQITYKISRKFEFKLAPFYQYAIFYEEKHPYSFTQRIGIEVGINFILYLKK